MVEKYRGIIPPKSIWYRLDRQESLALLRHQGRLEQMTPQEIAQLDSTDILGIKGEIETVEQTFRDAGLNIVTLHD